MAGLFKWYANLPRTARLYIGVSTLAIAYLGDKWTGKRAEDQALRAEAERRLALENEKRQKTLNQNS
jgi:hypothetical protein